MAKSKLSTRLQIFQEAVDYDEIYCIVRKQVDAAKKGDPYAYDRVMDGRFGKLTDKLEATVESLGPGAEEIAKRYAERAKATK